MSIFDEEDIIGLSIEDDGVREGYWLFMIIVVDDEAL